MLQGKLKGCFVADDEGQFIACLGTWLSVLSSTDIKGRGRTSEVGHSPIPTSE
jgi:hypothetical protein